ncbi:hypothetical protein CSKR_114192 [Clonorchis sinensis]|uniref:Uncharacterized protein n=1 Tax=Clonorchis sinensis TaxID=79923 RepID=A0A3R7D0I1_CLOSI|nr:hypothetical protein CSKR_114192 [Clonorchis sinensis]
MHCVWYHIISSYVEQLGKLGSKHCQEASITGDSFHLTCFIIDVIVRWTQEQAFGNVFNKRSMTLLTGTRSQQPYCKQVSAKSQGGRRGHRTVLLTLNQSRPAVVQRLVGVDSWMDLTTQTSSVSAVCLVESPLDD